MTLFKNIMDHIEEYFLSLALAVMTIMVIAQILFRYVIEFPLDWSEEIARFLFVWIIYMGASLAIKKHQHLKIEAGLYLFPRRLRPWVGLVGNFLFIAFALVMLYDSIQHLYRISWTRPQVSPALMISMGFAYGAIPVSLALMIFRLIQECSHFFREKIYLDTNAPIVTSEDIENLD